MVWGGGLSRRQQQTRRKSKSALAGGGGAPPVSITLPARERQDPMGFQGSCGHWGLGRVFFGLVE